MLAAALCGITLVGGIVATSWQWHVSNRERMRAEKRFQDVRGLANSVLFELHDAIVPLPGSTHARELLVKRAQQYLDSLASESADDDGLQRERAMAYERIGDVLGSPVQAEPGPVRRGAGQLPQGAGDRNAAWWGGMYRTRRCSATWPACTIASAAWNRAPANSASPWNPAARRAYRGETARPAAR